MHVRTPRLPVLVRHLVAADICQVLEIEKASSPLPWNRADFIQCLRRPECRPTVAEYHQRLVGFTVCDAVDGDIRVLNFAVDPSYRRLGVGSQLVTTIIEAMYRCFLSCILVNVRETNLPAQHFFRSQGFLATGVLREWYNDTSEDAYVMEYAVD